MKERLLRERVAAATALEALERRQQTLQLTTLRLFDYIKGTRVAARGRGGRVDMTKVLSPAWPAFLAAPFRTWHALAAESLRLLGQARRFLGRHVLRRVRAVLHAWSRAARAIHQEASHGHHVVRAGPVRRGHFGYSLRRGAATGGAVRCPPLEC